MKRRVFLKVVGGAAGGCAVGLPSMLGANNSVANVPEEKVAGLPRRVLGRTGQKISVVGFPGLALMHYDQERCTTALHEAFDKGLNYYDVAPEYDQRRCETKMGIGLQGLDRSRYFLACKTGQRDKAGAQKELEESLKLLKTDYFDLYQLHHLRRPEEVKQALGPGGAIEAFVKAREQGKVKYLGFSAHTTKGALEVMKGFQFDTVMFPINFIEFMNLGFSKPVLDLARSQGVGVLAIKPLSMGAWPAGAEKKRNWWYRTTETDLETSLAMRFTLSQPGVVAGIPPSFLDLLDKAIVAAKSYRPINSEELAELQKIATNSLSVFKSEEDRVALNTRTTTPLYADSPYESCPHAAA
jgi:predicted aldo/keto reductase-like oxidoreductase